ncbi:hypothetical protein RF11_15947 [Thelohanellus kitauei]|uniref:Uncharacterized protein n=1 Tax=Thelohanellus kitauei TaxID=669202 RepID=A0A0C2JBB2_THEKT|nr:hypothetical protein RF11_15947 [Thelohanellus kitauei]
MNACVHVSSNNIHTLVFLNSHAIYCIELYSSVHSPIKIEDAVCLIAKRLPHSTQLTWAKAQQLFDKIKQLKELGLDCDPFIVNNDWINLMVKGSCTKDDISKLSSTLHNYKLAKCKSHRD